MILDPRPVLALPFRLIMIAGERDRAGGKLGNTLASLSRQGAPAQVWMRCHGMPQRKIEELKAHPQVVYLAGAPVAGSPVEMRNALLALALKDAEGHEIIAFPDADAVYADGTLKAVAKMFAMSPRIDFFIGVNEATPSIADIHKSPEIADLEICEDYGKPGTLFVRASALARIRDKDGRYFGALVNDRKVKGDPQNLTLALLEAGCTGLGLPNLKIGSAAQPAAASGLLARLSALMGS